MTQETVGEDTLSVSKVAKPQIDTYGLPVLTKKLGRPLGSRDKIGLVRKNSRPAKPKKVKLKNVATVIIDKIEKFDPNIGERFFNLSFLEIFHKTLDWRDLEILGVNKQNIVALMIFGNFLVMDKRMPVSRLRHFECTEEQLNADSEDYEVADIFMSMGALKSALGDERAKEIYLDIKGTEKVRINRKILRLIGADISDIAQYIGDFAIKEKISLSFDDLVKLGLKIKNPKELDEKLVTITVLPGHMFKSCVQAERCQLKTRCYKFAQEQLIDGLQYFSCHKCLLLEMEARRLAERGLSQLDLVSRMSF